jgi:hypothetical protein
LQSPESDHTKRFEPAHIDCAARITALYDRCKKNLLAQGILQWGEWDAGYPGEDFVASMISRHEMYVFRSEDRIIGVAALNNEQSRSGISFHGASHPADSSSYTRSR